MPCCWRESWFSQMRNLKQNGRERTITNLLRRKRNRRRICNHMGNQNLQRPLPWWSCLGLGHAPQQSYKRWAAMSASWFVVTALAISPNRIYFASAICKTIVFLYAQFAPSSSLWHYEPVIVQARSFATKRIAAMAKSLVTQREGQDTPACTVYRSHVPIWATCMEFPVRERTSLSAVYDALMIQTRGSAHS